MAEITDSKSIMKSQEALTRTYVLYIPTGQKYELAEALEAKGFVAVPKNEVTADGIYGTQGLLCQWRKVTVKAGRTRKQVLTYFDTRGGQLVGNFDLASFDPFSK